MTLTRILLEEAESTYAATERLFLRATDAGLSWRPAQGSNWMTMGQLLMHCADDLVAVLGRTAGLWNELKDLLAVQFDAMVEEWVYSGKNYGWSLRLKLKKRAILYMTPCARHFRVGYALGEKAVQAALQSELPAAIRAIIDEAPKYPEGRGVRMEIRSRKDVRNAVKLAAIKMAN